MSVPNWTGCAGLLIAITATSLCGCLGRDYDPALGRITLPGREESSAQQNVLVVHDTQATQDEDYRLSWTDAALRNNPHLTQTGSRTTGRSQHVTGSPSGRLTGPSTRITGRPNTTRPSGRGTIGRGTVPVRGTAPRIRIGRGSLPEPRDDDRGGRPPVRINPAVTSPINPPPNPGRGATLPR